MRSLLIIPMVLLASCSQAQFVADGVNKYCEIPAESRAANREAVAVAVAPNRIEITCVE